jgi:site-specific DNA-methyltransferase (adenine-specific)
MDWTLDTWSINPESAKRIGHPAPFPVELPRRLIELYSYSGDLIMDPFCGSGTTCVAALQAGRDYLGFDVDEKYVKLARNRVKNVQQTLSGI